MNEPTDKIAKTEEQIKDIEYSLENVQMYPRKEARFQRKIWKLELKRLKWRRKQLLRLL